MITAEAYEFEGERFVKLTSELGGTMDVAEAEYLAFAGERPAIPLRDYDDAIATLGRSLESQGISQAALAERLGRHRQQISPWILGDVEMRSRALFALAAALGYDLALIPRQDSDA